MGEVKRKHAMGDKIPAHEKYDTPPVAVMMLYTSDFDNASAFDDRFALIGIAGQSPKDWTGLEYKKLAPSKDIYFEWHEAMRRAKGQPDRTILERNACDRYVERFVAERLGKLDKGQVIKDLLVLAQGKIPVLMCYEEPGEFCHHHIVAKWLQENTGIIAEEWEVINRMEVKVNSEPVTHCVNNFKEYDMGKRMSKEERTNAIFDRLWAGKRVWDALMDMEGNRNIHLEKAINLKSVSTRGYDGAFYLKYTMDWKDAGFKVVLRGECRPWSGWFDMLWDSLFGSQDDKCLVKAVKWLDAACDKEQTVLVNVDFMLGDTSVEGVKRNAKLVELFIKYLNSLEPEVSVADANLKADEVIQKAARLDRALDLVSGVGDLHMEERN